MTTQYRITLKTFPFLGSSPTIDSRAGEGNLIVVGSLAMQNLTLLLPEKTLFYLYPTITLNSLYEDPTIIRRVTSAFFNSATLENIFTFSPEPAFNWSTPVIIVTQPISQLLPAPTSYFGISQMPTATKDMIEACIQAIPPS